jgi:hypothetical protein
MLHKLTSTLSQLHALNCMAYEDGEMLTKMKSSAIIRKAGQDIAFFWVILPRSFRGQYLAY